MRVFAAIMYAATLLFAFVPTAARAAELLLPPVGVGEQLPGPGVLAKIDELTQSAYHRRGVEPPTQAVSPAALDLNDALQAYYDIDFAVAISKAESALRHLRDHPEDLGGGDAYVAAHLVAALTMLEQDDREGANKHLMSVLNIRPDHQLSEDEFPPTVLAAFEMARDAWGRQREGASFTVTSTPGFAVVRIDGREVGKTPLQLPDVTKGAHFVEVTLPGYRAHAVWTSVKGADSSVTLQLSRDPVIELKSAIAAGIAAGAQGEMLSASGRDLAAAAACEAVSMVGVAAAGDRYLLSMARIDSAGESVRTYGTVGRDLAAAPKTIGLMVAALMGPPAAKPALIGDAPGAGNYKFGKAFLGLMPPPKPVVLTRAPPPPRPLWQNHWVWTGAAVMIIAAGASAVYIAGAGDPEPGKTIVTVELPQ